MYSDTDNAVLQHSTTLSLVLMLIERLDSFYEGSELLDLLVNRK